MSTEELQRLRGVYDELLRRAPEKTDRSRATELILALEFRVKELEQQIDEAYDIREACRKETNDLRATRDGMEAQIRAMMDDHEEEREELLSLRAKLSGEPDGWGIIGPDNEFIDRPDRRLRIYLNGSDVFNCTLAHGYRLTPVKLVRMDEEMISCAKGDPLPSVRPAKARDGYAYDGNYPPGNGEWQRVDSRERPAPIRHTCDHAFPVDGDHERQSIDDATPEEWRKVSVPIPRPGSRLLSEEGIRELQRKTFESARAFDEWDYQFRFETFDDYIKSTEGK